MRETDVLFAASMRGKLIARIPYPSMGEQVHPASPTNRQRIPQGLLVRPDGHVAWRGDRAPGSDVVAQVRGF